MVLLARTKQGLQETEAQLLAHAPGVSVHSIQADLGKLENLESIFSEITQFTDHLKHKQAVLIHNAATLGDITKNPSKTTVTQRWCRTTWPSISHRCTL